MVICKLHDGDGKLTDMINQGDAQAELVRKAMVDPYTNILVGTQTYKKLYDGKLTNAYL